MDPKRIRPERLRCHWCGRLAVVIGGNAELIRQGWAITCGGDIVMARKCKECLDKNKALAEASGTEKQEPF